MPLIFENMNEKPEVLSNGLILIKVPKEAININIYNKNTLRYQIGIIPTYENLPYMNWNYELIGWLTKYECSFDCSQIKGIDSFVQFKKLILSETDFRFSNQLGDYNNALKRHIVTGTWQQYQDKVVEKLVILRELNESTKPKS